MNVEKQRGNPKRPKRSNSLNTRRDFLSMLAMSIAASGYGQIRLPIDGGPGPRPTPTPRPSNLIAPLASDVFTNVAQTWNFVDGHGYHMTINVNPIAQAFGSSGDITVWHYTKDNCAGYWNPRTPEQCAVATNLDELYFVLRHDPDGAWRCIGFTYIDYLGQKWKVQILKQATKAPPYTIIPAASNVSDPDTNYDAIVQASSYSASLTDFSPINSPVNFTSPWRTDASSENGKLISLQHEGCITEKWTFGSTGLERVVPVVNIGNGGSCLPMPPEYTMVRI